MTITPHRLFSLDYERLFTQMIVVSVVVHIGALIAAIALPGLFPSKPPAPPPSIEIDLSVALPKGPGLSTQAPDQNQAAVRRSDPRSMQDIQRERQQELDNDTVRPTDRRPVPTNRLGFQDQLAMHAAVERIRQRHDEPLMETVGGGGAGDVSTSGILANYIALVRSRILRVWTLPGGLPNEYLVREIKVRVYIAPSGEIINQVLAAPSGFEPLDRSCQSAVLKASPLPSPPLLLQDRLRTQGIDIYFHPREKKH
jgi:TonB family protein